MSNPVMLITGASSGIGAATALLAAERGYDLVITYLNHRRQAENVVQKIIALGRNALCVQADVGIESDVLALFSQIDNSFGRLDVLVNNAAILRQKLLRDTHAAELEKLFAVNVIGSFICAREAIKRMSKIAGGQGGGYSKCLLRCCTFWLAV